MKNQIKIIRCSSFTNSYSPRAIALIALKSVDLFQLHDEPIIKNYKKPITSFYTFNTPLKNLLLAT
jgi:hypothetical protein